MNASPSKFCHQCGKPLIPESTFCGICGARLIKTTTPKSTQVDINRIPKPSQKKHGSLKFVFATVIAIWIIYNLFKPTEGIKSVSTNSDTTSTKKGFDPYSTRNIVYNSSWDGSVRQVEDWFERNLKDPKSVDVIEWYEVKKNDQQGFYIVRCDFRAKNSFGGYVVHNYNFYIDFSGNMIGVRDFANGNELVWGK